MSVPELEKKIAELNSELEAKIMEVADLREQAIRNVLPVLPEAHFDKRLGLGGEVAQWAPSPRSADAMSSETVGSAPIAPSRLFPCADGPSPVQAALNPKPAL
jgi:hypothetical protein